MKLKQCSESAWFVISSAYKKYFELILPLLYLAVSILICKLCCTVQTLFCLFYQAYVHHNKFLEMIRIQSLYHKTLAFARCKAEDSTSFFRHIWFLQKCIPVSRWAFFYFTPFVIIITFLISTSIWLRIGAWNILVTFIFNGTIRCFIYVCFTFWTWFIIITFLRQGFTLCVKKFGPSYRVRTVFCFNSILF